MTSDQIRLSASKLVMARPIELKNSLTGVFTILFDDGEILTDWKQTLYSSYVWEFHRLFPGAKVLKSHHVSSVLKGNRLSGSTHMKLIGNVLWSIYDQLSVSMNEAAKETFRYDLARAAYEITSTMYSEVSYMAEEYVGSLDIEDFVEIFDHPEIQDSYRRLYEVDATVKNNPGLDKKRLYEKAGNDVYDTITKVLNTDAQVANNPLAKLTKSKLIKHDQTLQCVGPRMFVTDIDSVQFKTPILRGYLQGFHLFYDSAIESRSAAKSLIFSKTPLQDAEYFSRKLQFMTMMVRNLHHGDCGSTNYLRWTVKPAGVDPSGMYYGGDLIRLVGKLYLDETGSLVEIKPSDTHLIGKTINLRSVIFCQHPDPVGVCSHCYGKLSESIPRNTNLGHANTTFMTEKSSQSVLSVKHKDASASIESIVLSDDEKNYLAVGIDGNSYLFAPSLKKSKILLKIARDCANNIIDVRNVDDVCKLKPSDITQLDTISITTIINNVETTNDRLVVAVNNRKASLTSHALDFIKKLDEKDAWIVDEVGNYVFDMEGWDINLPILELPLKHYNMADHSAEISDLLESSVSDMIVRDRFVQPETVLKNLFELVNSRLTVNLAVLEVVLYGTMIVSAEQYDYSLPKPWTQTGLGVRVKTMNYRSLSVAMAYQGHTDIINNPDSYIIKNRPDHLFDYILMPREVSKYGVENIG